MAHELTRLVAEALRISEQDVSAPGLQFEDLPTWDSMARIELVVSLEDRYGIELSHTEVAELTSLDAVQTLLAGRGQVADAPR